jgi:hypothetical protein
MRGKWTNARLRKLFHRYNQMYWDGKLLRFDVCLVQMSDASNWDSSGRCFHRLKRIEIDPQKTGNVQSTLLHEMAHAATGEKAEHGPKWEKEILRLIGLGAPISPSELLFSDHICKKIENEEAEKGSVQTSPNELIRARIQELGYRLHQVQEEG